MRRDYTGPDDLRLMQGLAERVSPITGYRHVGDLAWNRFMHTGREAEWPTALWEKDGRVLGWGWLEMPTGLMLQVDPAHPELADDILAWALDRSGADHLEVDVCETETALVEALHRRRAVRVDGPFMACLGRDLTDLPSLPQLPPGFTLRQVTWPGDADRRAAAHQAAFHPSRVTAESLTRLAEAWPYRADLDLVVEAPDGTFATYCQGWLDEANGIGEFEPVGTHPDHRRRGFARAVCLAALHGFARLGATKAVVYSRGDDDYPVPKKLYESMGFTTYARTATYRLGL
jgi:ribosomal protein S18 acetylase RimI-like enzyme